MLIDISVLFISLRTLSKNLNWIHSKTRQLSREPFSRTFLGHLVGAHYEISIDVRFRLWRDVEFEMSFQLRVIKNIPMVLKQSKQWF